MVTPMAGEFKVVGRDWNGVRDLELRWEFCGGSEMRPRRAEALGYFGSIGPRIYSAAVM